MYILDTNVISELRRARPHGGVLAWLDSVDVRTAYLSAVSLAELQAGIELTRDQNPGRAAELEIWLDQIIGSWTILPMDGATFRLWAKLMHRKSDTVVGDAMIAATALVHRFTVVTRNTRHFKDFGVALIDPFSTR
jgi:predicted nucleic acid-binding protein